MIEPARAADQCCGLSGRQQHEGARFCFRRGVASSMRTARIVAVNAARAAHCKVRAWGLAESRRSLSQCRFICAADAITFLTTAPLARLPTTASHILSGPTLRG